MNTISTERLPQRAELTHKANANAGRHGWLRLTPAYSVRVVEQILNRNRDAMRVLDPFCGTATTALCAAALGHDAVSTDINPFLVWFGNAKTSHYSDETISSAKAASDEIIAMAASLKHENCAPPSIHNIERWWAPRALEFLCRLRSAINQVVGAHAKENDLLRIAFCRTLIKCSNAAFNHQSMSFRDAKQIDLHLETDFGDLYQADVSHVLSSAIDNPVGSASIRLHDARQLETMGAEKFDLIVTSPPYANRMSYIRELRPYMYWLGFLNNGRDAGELDWQAIGGTWGIATSRLSDWLPSGDASIPKTLQKTLERISGPDNANGKLLATYVHKYCEDMALHFNSLISVLSPGARVHYIVGNSTFYGELLPVEEIYAAQLSAIGFSNVSIEAIRKRNSKRALVEFDVSGVWR